MYSNKLCSNKSILTIIVLCSLHTTSYVSCIGLIKESVKKLSSNVSNKISNKSNQSNNLINEIKYESNESIKDKIKNLDNPQEINNQDKQGFTLLIQASKDNNNDITNFLITNTKANLDIANKVGDTALIWAARNNNEKIVKKLINNGAKLNIKNKSGNSALSIACENGNLEITKWLLESETKSNTNGESQLDIPNKKGYTPLMLATKNNHTQIIEYLLEKDPKIINTKTKPGYSAIIVATENGYPTLIQMLILNGANPDETSNLNFTPLMLAAKNNHLESVKILLEAGADINLQSKNNHSAISIAADNQYSRISSLLRTIMLAEDKALSLKNNGNVDIEKEDPEIKNILIKRWINRSRLKFYPLLIKMIEELDDTEKKSIFSKIVINRLTLDKQIPKISNRNEIDKLLELAKKHAPENF